MATDPQKNADYSRGYQAGLKKKTSEVLELQKEVSKLRDEKRERVYLSCLRTVTANCSGWEMGGEKIDNTEKYTKLAEIFARHSIEILSK
jgi:hypothetical protein